MGFDATCSLVIFGTDLKWDVIMWMDHRAKAETAFINGLHHPVLNYVGGKVSLEMETPKLLWLKKNRPDIFDKATAFFDLPDFLTFKATGNEIRSLCTLVCKWTFRGVADENGGQGWDQDYFNQIGIGSSGIFEKIGGQKVAFPGDYIGHLNSQTAQDLGLDES